jgi:hypothetical protein
MRYRPKDESPMGSVVLDRWLRIFVILIACFTSVVAVGLSLWKKRQAQPTAAVERPHSMDDDAKAKRIATATALVGNDRGLVLFSHGTAIAVPWPARVPGEMATAALKTLKTDAPVTEKAVEGGHLLLNLGGPAMAFVYKEEIELAGKEKALAKVKSAFEADIAEPVIVKILLPKQASGENPPGQ